MLSERSKRIGSLLVRAADIALRFYDAPGAEIKSDHTVVTRADKAVEDMLLRELEDESSGVRVIGEETSEAKSRDYIEAALRGKTWIVDPIDGTAMYACRIPVWGITVGYAENGCLLEGGIVAPCTGEMMLSDSGTTYYTGPGGVQDLPDWEARLKPMRPPETIPDEKAVFAVSQRIIRNGTVKTRNVLNAFASTIYAMLLTATGRHAGMLHSAKLWDYAGSLPCLKNLGFQCVAKSGADLLNLEISQANYDLRENAPVPFAAHGILCFAANRPVAEFLSSIYELRGENDHV